MEKRRIGQSALEIAPLVFGGNVFGWTIDEPTSFQVLDAFLDAGFDCVDTANVYSRWAPGNQGGESEIIIGKWLKQRGNRDKVILATKVGAEMAPDQKGLKKAYILREVEASLRRLQTDYIDLYQSHYDDPATPIEESLEAYEQLLKAGKIRAIGASNFSPERLAEALRVGRERNLPLYQCLQPEYNLYERAGYEQALEPICRENNLGVISYFSLASGFLTGKYRSEQDMNKSARGRGMQKYFNERGFRILNALDEIGRQYNASPAAVALAWLMARPGITAPIASATSVPQLNELAKAAQLQLDKAAIEKLNQASAEVAAQA